MGTPTGEADSTTGQVRLRYWASARSAAGVEEDVLELTGSVSLETLRGRAKQLHAGSPRFSAVLDTCSVLVGDRPVGSGRADEVYVEPGDIVEFLPPFAGG